MNRTEPNRTEPNRATAVPCKFPGCAAEVAEGELCAVHQHPSGAKYCETCHGTGKHFYSGQNLTMACQRCGGTGFKDAKTSHRVPAHERESIDERDLMKKMRGA